MEKIDFRKQTSEVRYEIRRRGLNLIKSGSTQKSVAETMGVRTKTVCSWGFTPQKPKKKAYEQNPKAVERWMEEEYPTIKKKAKSENAEIDWGDETGIKNSSHYGSSYAPRGKTPVRRTMGKRLSLNMISSITNQGKVKFMIYSGTMNSDSFLKFLRQLIKNRERKIYLILDNLKVHHSKIVKKWVEKNKRTIELFFLPSY